MDLLTLVSIIAALCGIAVVLLFFLTKFGVIQHPLDQHSDTQSSQSSQTYVSEPGYYGVQMSNNTYTIAEVTDDGLTHVLDFNLSYEAYQSKSAGLTPLTEMTENDWNVMTSS